MLDFLSVVLVSPKYPENIGSAARACANMGCRDLVVVAPKRWDETKAAMLGTPQATQVLRRMRVEQDLAATLAGFNLVLGTTARVGGWRKDVLSPQAAAAEVAAVLAEPADGTSGERPTAALVFGPEDRGMTNEEIELCGRLATIPTADEASSLNLAHAVLIMLYECFQAVSRRPAGITSPVKSPLITHGEQETLLSTLEQVFEEIDFFKDENRSYWMMPVRRFVQRIKMRRSEFNLVMGVCRQVLWRCGLRKNGK